MNNIILIDDDQTFITSFVNEAVARNITVSPKNSLEGLKILLPKFAHKYAAVVLDIKCLLKDDQIKEDVSFIGAALKYLDSTTFDFPRFILTGDDSEFESLKKYYPDEKMFLKKPDDQQKLFNELNDCIKNAEHLRLKRENSIVFEVFDKGLLNLDKEKILISILKNYNENNFSNFRGVIGDIREIHEEIYKSLNIRNKKIVPDLYINGSGSPIFNKAFYTHLEGNLDPSNKFIPRSTVYQDSTLLSETKFIHQACSEFLHGTSKCQYNINNYTVKALVNALMELIIWSKGF